MKAVQYLSFCVLLSACSGGSFALASPRIEFLEEHCISCHGPKKQKGDHRFDDLSTTVSSIDELELWQEILDMLNLEDMPPEDEPQPSEGERAEMITSTTEFVTTTAHCGRQSPLLALGTALRSRPGPIP